MGYLLRSFSLPQTRSGSDRVFHRILTRGRRVAGCSLFRRVCSPAAREASYKGTSGSLLQIPGFQAMQRTMMLFMPQDPLPRTASPDQGPPKPCMSVGPTATAVWDPLGPHISWDVPSCSGDNGGLLLPLLLPHLQSQHCPAVQVWEGREAVRH